MKDFLGQKISLGDVVVYKLRDKGGTGSNLFVGRIERLTPCKVFVDSHPLEPTSLVKVDDKFYPQNNCV